MWVTPLRHRRTARLGTQAVSVAALVVATSPGVHCATPTSTAANGAASPARDASRVCRSGRDSERIAGCRSRETRRQAGAAGAAEKEGRRQCAGSRRRDRAPLGDLSERSGQRDAAHSRRRERECQEQLRRVAHGARRETGKRLYSRPVDEGRRRPERRDQFHQCR